MRRGPFALGLLVLVVLCAASTGARAATDPFISAGAPADWCVRGDGDRSSAEPATATTAATVTVTTTVTVPAHTTKAAKIVDRIVERVDRLVASQPLVYESRASVATPVWPLVPGPESLLCANGGFGADCQAHDPAERPVPPSPISILEQNLAPTEALAPHARDVRIVAPPLGALGAARPGYDRGLFRPPRV